MILCVWDRVWGVSITTLDCGLTVILAVVIAVHGPGAQHMAALSSLLMRTSLWTQWRCGPWENFQSLKRSAHSFAALAFTEISKVTFSQHNICVLVSGWRGKAKEEYPKCGSIQKSRLLLRWQGRLCTARASGSQRRTRSSNSKQPLTINVPVTLCSAKATSDTGCSCIEGDVCYLIWCSCYTFTDKWQ